MLFLKIREYLKKLFLHHKQMIMAHVIKDTPILRLILVITGKVKLIKYMQQEAICPKKIVMK